MTFGTPSSAPFVEDYAKALAPLGPTSKDIFINSNFTPSNWRFGPVSSEEYLIGTNGAIGLRGPQFKQNDIALDRFAKSLFSVISVTESIDLTATGLTTLYTVPSGKTALISGVVLRVTGSSSATVPAQASIEGASTIFAVETLADVLNVHDTWTFWHDKSTTVQAIAADVISLDVDTAATATTLDATAFLIGLLI
jgi:hypothetical protein